METFIPFKINLILQTTMCSSALHDLILFLLSFACKYELSGLAQRKVICHLLTARVLVIWSFCTYKILSEFHS